MVQGICGMICIYTNYLYLLCILICISMYIFIAKHIKKIFSMAAFHLFCSYGLMYKLNMPNFQSQKIPNLYTTAVQLTYTALHCGTVRYGAVFWHTLVTYIKAGTIELLSFTEEGKHCRNVYKM